MQQLTEIDNEFSHLRISALLNACEISPSIHEVTIGPHSCNEEIQLLHSEEDEDTVQPTKVNSSQSAKKTDAMNLTYEKMVETQGGTCTLSRLLHYCNIQSKEEAKKTQALLLARMGARRAESMNNNRHKLELEYEERLRRYQKSEIEILQELAKDDKIAKMELEKLDQVNKARVDRMKEMEEQLKRSSGINCIYHLISLDYQEIMNAFCYDKVVDKEIFMEFESKLKTISNSANLVIEKCKTGSVTSHDLNQMIELEAKIKDLKEIIFTKIKNSHIEPIVSKPEVINNHVNINKHIESPSVPPSNESVVHVNPKENETKNNVKSVPLNKYYSERSYNRYLEYKQFATNYENQYKELLNDARLKKFRFDCQKAVNTPVNAISSLSGEHIKDKYEKLSKLLSGDKVLVGDSYISASQHPLGKFYCMDLLARKIVRQGEVLVSSSPEAAFPIASVAVALWANFPEFGTLLCAHFHKVCPYLVPMILPRIVDQTDEEFYRSRGYTYDEENVIEKQDKFLKRISGIFKLYASIWVIKMPRSVRAPHPQDLSHAWKWLAAFVNLNPETDISATLLYDFLTICGNDFFKCYKLQFNKILKYLISDYFSELEKIDNGGPKTRLDVFMQNIINDGRIPPPNGILSDYFW